ncbi:uncharacterized protein LOC143082747 isoform X2 [Mytilus galloprovincialis]|uniref:uncharacterized protein LOC143082747 isoform X2 n=1 Tax=Mytilus galloprovincialis TaxID=29158 RepID=UPI003F7CD0EF
MTICAICLEHLEQPVCCIPCGHLYCNQCISDWRNGHNSRCPECREPFTTVQSIYLDTESIRGLIVERTRLNDSVNELTATIENLRQNPSNEDQKVIEFEEMKDNFERAEAICQSLQIQNSVLNLELKRANIRKRSTATAKGFRRMIFLIEKKVLDSIMFIEDNSVAHFATIIFLIFTSVCFVYLGVCIFSEWFSEKPDYLEDVVVRHLGFLSGSSAFISSTFLSAVNYVDYCIGTYPPAGINYITNFTHSIAEKASTYYSKDVQNFDYKITVYWACQVVNFVLFILHFLIFFAIFSFLVLFTLICFFVSYAVLISIYCFLLICLCSLVFLKTLLQTFLLR